MGLCGKKIMEIFYTAVGVSKDTYEKTKGAWGNDAIKHVEFLKCLS